MKEVIKKERLKYIDDVKGLAILLVVIGHTCLGNNLFRIWIYSFHIPLFFILSGIVLRHTNVEKKDIKNIIISKFKSLIIPYICFEGIAIFVWMIINEFSLTALKWNVIDSILMKCRAGATWFLPTLFVIDLLFILIIKYIRNKSINKLIFIVLFSIPLVISSNNHYIILIFRCFIGLGFLGLGYYCYNYIVNENISLVLLSIIIILNLILVFINGKVELWNLQFNNQILYVLNCLVGSISLIYLFKKLNSNKILTYFGINSLIIMATQEIILYIINNITGTINYNYLVGGLIVALIMLIEIPIIHIINNYMPFVIGNFKIKKYNSCLAKIVLL